VVTKENFHISTKSNMPTPETTGVLKKMLETAQRSQEEGNVKKKNNVNGNESKSPQAPNYLPKEI